MRALDYWIRSVFGDFAFAALIVLAFLVAIFSTLW